MELNRKKTLLETLMEYMTGGNGKYYKNIMLILPGSIDPIIGKADQIIENNSIDILNAIVDRVVEVPNMANDQKIDWIVLSTNETKYFITLMKLLMMIRDLEDQEIPETVVLVVDGKEILEDWSGNILKNTPQDILNRRVKCFCSRCLVMDGSCFEIQV